MQNPERRKHRIEELVVNWHITEACNYACRYCYSAWVRECRQGDLVQNPKDSLQLLQDLYQFFRPTNSTNPLHSVFDWKKLRLSLAGGETLLYPGHTKRIVHEAKNLGFNLSLITNASLLDNPEATDMINSLSMLGISLDSANPQTNRLIGRVNTSNQVIDLDDLSTKINQARATNPNLVIKINTVVNKYNTDEDLTELIERLQPDKWKVLRVLPIISDDLAVSDLQFHSFTERHQHLGKVLSVEDNQDMTESYLMIDPLGRFFQNQHNPTGATPYIYSKPILQVGVETAFNQINFDAEKFAGRYSKPTVEVAA